MTVLGRMMRYVARYWLLATLSLIAVAGVSALGLVQPLVVRWAVDTVLTRRQYGILGAGAAAIVAVSLVRGVITFVQRYTMELTAQRISYDMRGDLYHHLQGLSFSFYDRARTGELMSRLTTDVDAINRFLGMGFIWIAGGFLGVAGGIVAMLYLNPLLTVVSLAFLPVLVRGAGGFSRKARPMFRGVQEQVATLNAALQESISGIRVVRAFARENEEIARFDRENTENRQRNVTLGRQLSYYANYMTFLSGVGPAVLLWFGGYLAVGGRFTVGSLAAMSMYLTQVVMPVRMLGFALGMYHTALAAGKRIFDVLDTRSDIGDRPGAVDLPRIKGLIRMEGVTFRSGGRTILEDINIEVRPGETVAILGPTGSGKSALVNLVPRFYDASEGRVTVDDRDVRGVTVDSLRRQIAMVSQDVFLFSASISENISYGRPNARTAEIERAARVAQIHEFIMSLPERYETVVGERGVGLSGGQKQRVAIARAVLMDAPVVILDESLSSVDAETESKIHEALEGLLEGRTCLVIAQRLSTVRMADRVLILERGRIAEQGRHSDLVNSGGLYTSIFRQYAGGSVTNCGGGEP